MSKIKIILNVLKKDVEYKTLIDVVDNKTPSGWSELFEKARPELLDISDILDEQEIEFGPYYPKKEDIFRAFHLTPLNRVRVVIIGQDPYHDKTKTTGEIRARGMSFSVSKTSDIPPSLRNIFKELAQSIPEFKTPKHGDLTYWAIQGVLMLNFALTVGAGRPGSHKKLWIGFIHHVIEFIIKTNPNTIFVLWGRKAADIKKMISGRCTILEAAHPSPYSAHKGFFGCKHFKIINEYLANDPIDWNVL